MRVTFVDKQSVFWSLPMIITYLVLILCVLESVNGWEHDDSGYLEEGKNCQIKTGEPGICKRITSCAVYYNALKQKTIKYSFLVRCSFIEMEEVICCPLEETLTSPAPPTTSDTTSASTTLAPELHSNDSLSNETERPSQAACKTYSGFNLVRFIFPILGGETVGIGEYSHIGGLIFPVGGGPDIENRCGTSLISERYVLTAAHCVADPILLPTFVRFGVVEWNSKDDTFPRVDVKIESVNGWEHDDSGYLEEGKNCQIKTGEPGICKRITSCAVYYNALKQKTIKYSFLVRCSFIEMEEVICCPLEETLTSPAPPTTSDTTSASTTLAPELHSNDSLSNETERPSQAACKTYSGFNLVRFIFPILGGETVGIGEYSHIGGLIFPVGGGPDIENRCGTSLISERYVLTAAHCVADPILLPTFVRFGVVEWNSKDDTFPRVDVKIENITMHPKYQSNMAYHDIALIKLSSDVEFTPFVRPACLYSDLKDIDSDTPLVVIGWGVTNVQNRTRSDVLLMTNVTTVDLRGCNASHIAYGTNRRYPSGLDEGQYCAFDPELKMDACQSDSGGPLQLVRNKESTIVGIVSFGISCGSAVPGVYVRVAYYLDWIESIVWPSRNDT